ncbi:MAG: DUF222 domain-containing protein [Sporichthyaceae bacterium]
MPDSPTLVALATAIAGAGPEMVRGYDTVDGLRAAERLQNAATAAKFTWIVEVSLRRPGSGHTVERLQIPHEYAADEIRAALGISATAAGKLLSLAWDAVKRLPELHAAMAEGGLDEQRAWAFADWTTELSDEHAHAVCAELLPRAVLDAEEQLPTGLLIKEIATTATALDPTWAERRYREALRRKRVVGRPNRDGTADLSGQQLEPHRVAAVCGRLNELARGAKRDGDPRPIDHIRAELYLGMLDGTYEGLTDTEIFAALAATRPGTADSEPPLEEAAAADEPAASPLPGKPESPQAAVQLRIRLTTLLGLDRAPAELAGWTHVNPNYAVDLTELMSAAEWRYALVDDDGRLIGSGLVRTRPKGWRRRTARHRGIVDLLVPASLLRDLVEDPQGAINLVDPDRYRSWHQVLHELADHMNHPKPRPDDSNRRMPGRALRREVELDKPRCVGVGCGRTATACEIDHRLDWALGGRTVGVNLAPGCGRDHALKTKGGWKLHTWTPGKYRWLTPLGRHYVVAVPRVIDHIPASRAEFWIEDCTHRPDPDADTDSEGIPWQTSHMWRPARSQASPAVHVRTTSPPPSDDPPF